MGASVGLAGGFLQTREVVLSLHSVHNVQHTPSESYYGMCTTHSPGAADVPVTSERPAHHVVDLDSVVSVRVFLHNRSDSSRADRPVGQVSVPIREAVKFCSAGLFQTWLLLDRVGDYDLTRKDRLVERFLRAIQAVPQNIHGMRICMSLLEVSAQPADWGETTDERVRARYCESVLRSRTQHSQMLRTYMEAVEAAGVGRQSGGHGEQAGGVEASDLRSELERLRQQQLEDEVAALHRELDQVTEEANSRIEQGNETIIKLKEELKQLRDVEGPRIEAEREQAKQRLLAAQAESERLRVLPPKPDAEGSADELSRLRQKVKELSDQKVALMNMVQDIYGSGGREDLAQGSTPPVFQPERKLLPDPRDLLAPK